MLLSYVALLTTLALCLIASSSPILIRDSKISLPFSIHFNISNTNATIADIDRARAKSFKSGKSNKRASEQSIGVSNTAVRSSYHISHPATQQRSFQVVYTTSIGIGNPPTQYTLLVDTGSSNTWIGASKAYTKTNTSIDTNNTVSVTYGTGSFSGEEYLDMVTLAPGLVVQNQSIGVAHKSEGFNSVDGILGIGPVDLTQHTLSNKAATIPTVTDNLFQQGAVPSNSIGISYNPIDEAQSLNGELTFGGTDSTKYLGSINYVPITSASPACEYWGVDQSVTYGSTTILSTTAGIADTGTTLILLATDAYQKYVTATNATLDSATGLLKLPSTAYSALENLTFRIGSQNYVLTPNAQIWPRSLNSGIGGSSDYIYLVVSNLGTHSGEGLDFINGYTFLERFYTVYDSGNHQVGFASTLNTNAITN